MIDNEEDLADAVMRGDSSIALSSALETCVTKIKNPDEVVWRSVAAALIASAFFWGGAAGICTAFAIGLPAVLAVCGGIGGIVFIILGANGTLCAYKLLAHAKTMDVLTKLRKDYELSDNILRKK